MKLNQLRITKWTVILCIATVIALIFAAQAYINSSRMNEKFVWEEQLLWTVSGWYLWAAVFPLIMRLAKRFRYEKGERLKSFLAHAGFGITIAAIHAAIQILVGNRLPHPERPWSETEKFFQSFYISMTFWRFIIYQALLAVCFALSFHKKSREVEIQSSRIEDHIMRAQMESLKMQIDPEFLFKSLKQLSELMHVDLRAADRMVARLGDYLRMTLDNAGNSEVTLREELDFLRCYLEIEKIRLKNQFQIELEVDRETLDVEVPNLILQAPVEDAIRRRTASITADPVKIKATISGQHLAISIVDPSAVSPPVENPRTSALLAKLNDIYSSSISFESVPGPNGLISTIEIPLNLEKIDPEDQVQEPEDRRIIDENAQPVQAPNPIRRWGIIVGSWTFVGIYFSVQNIIIHVSGKMRIWWNELLFGNANWYFWALITPFVLKLSEKYPLRKGKILKHGAIHILGNLTAWFYTTMANVILYWSANLGQEPFFENLPKMLTGSQFSLDIFCYWTIIALENAIRYYKRFEHGRMRSIRLSAQLARARLQALKMQLHPHFLFNTLNSISELMQEDAATADKMISHLEKFLRLTVNSTDAQEISFEKELEFLKCYLAIEHVRFQDRLSIHMDIDPGTLRISVPNLVLQPIVENAIRHGIAPRTSPGQINITAKRINGMLKVCVQDNGPGLSDSQRKVIQSRTGLGLSNTRERLSQLYGSDHRFELKNAPEGGLIVTLEIPAADAFFHAENRKVS